MIVDLLAGLPTLTILVMLVTVAFGAGVMRGFSGFGGGLLMAPVYSLFIAPGDVVVLITILNLLSTIQLLPQIRRDTLWRLTLWLCLAAFVGVPVGVVMLHVLDSHLVRKVIALVVIGMSLAMLRGWRYRGSRGRPASGAVGFLSGLLTSLGGVGGPPLILYLLSDRQLTTAQFRATTLMFFFVVQIVALAQILLSHAGSVVTMRYLVLLLPVYLVAHWLGAFWYGRSRQQARFRVLSLWFLLLVGVLTFVI